MSSDGNANDTVAQPSLSPESVNIAQHESSSNQDVAVAINSMLSNFDKTNDLISRLVHAIETKTMQAEKLAPKRVIEVTDNNSDEPTPKKTKIAPKTGQHSGGKDHNYNKPPEEETNANAISLFGQSDVSDNECDDPGNADHATEKSELDEEFLNDISLELYPSDNVGPPVAQKLAEITDKNFKTVLETEKLKSIFGKHKRPEICEQLLCTKGEP